MAERVLRSPGVATREIDLSAPGRVQPQGIPAGVIGTSQKGPAFVPTVFANTNEFTNLFGASDGKYFGVMAVKEWLRNARSGLFLRVLGVGDGKKADANNITTNAGFLVGDKIRNQSSTALETDGAAIGRAVNPYAGAAVPDVITKATVGTPTVTVTQDIEEGVTVTVKPSTTDNQPGTAFAAGNLDAFDGFYILVKNISDTKNYVFWLSSQAGRTIDGFLIKDGTYTVKDLTGIATESASIRIVDISGDGNANDLADAIKTSIDSITGLGSTVTNNVIKINQTANGAGAFTRLTGATGVTTVEAYNKSDAVDSAQIPVSASTAIGVTGVAGVATVNTLTFRSDSTIAVGSTVVVTTPDGTATTITYVASGGNGTTTIDPAAAGNATAVALRNAIDAITGVSAPSPGGLVVTATFVVPSAGEQNPTIVINENSPNASPGRLYFLGARMATNSEDVDYLGRLQTDVELATNTNKKILRGVLMFPSGVIPGLADNDGGGGFTIPSFHSSGTAYDDDYSNDIGSHEGALQAGKFVMLLNGFNHTAAKAPRVITGSMDPLSPIYFAKVFNTDPTKIQEKGHYLHAHYDIPAGIGSHTTAANQNNAILAKGTFNPHAQAADFEAGSGYKPSFEKWEQKFEHAYTPWITSQTLGNSRKKLFRFWMLDAGSGGHGQIKISIANIQKSTDTSSDYGRFDVQIRNHLTSMLLPLFYKHSLE